VDCSQGPRPPPLCRPRPLTPTLNRCCFYRSDFVIQCGLQRPDGSAVANPHADLRVNETAAHTRISNTRGAAAVAHWDVPDNGNSEFFINLKTNAHLDTAYGGYCVFAEVVGEESFRVVDAIAAAVLAGKKPGIRRAHINMHIN
jgi:cyclophilin family peptidyl-prolyl cis-trans isomerase